MKEKEKYLEVLKAAFNNSFLPVNCFMDLELTKKGNRIYIHHDDTGGHLLNSMSLLIIIIDKDSNYLSIDSPHLNINHLAAIEKIKELELI